MANAIEIKKNYEGNGNPKDGGYYYWTFFRTKVDNKEIMERELSCPFWVMRKEGKKRHVCGKTITLAVERVKDLSELYTNINPLASELFDTLVSGHCYIVFEKPYVSDKEYIVITNLMKAQLQAKGATDRTFNY
jgi:hypothetical protein